MTPILEQPYLRYATPTSDHPNPFYADMWVVPNVYFAARLITAAIGEQTELEAGSLVYGGLNDLDAAWTTDSGHTTHRTGTDIDFDSSVDTRRRHLRIIEAAQVIFPVCQVHSRNHVHCYARPYF